MSKFQIKLNSGLPGVKASVGAGATVTATIDNTAGFGSFSWSVAGTDETTDWEAVAASIVTSGARNETATFVVGGVGSAVCIQAVADGGINQRTGAADPTLVATAKAFVPAANGAEVITINETRESDATWAYTALVNNAIRATYGGGPVLSDDAPETLGAASPGTSGQASRADHVHAHGDLAGGSLHEVAVASTGGVGGSAGFASPAMAEAAGEVPQMLLDIADLTDTVGALPSTLEDYVLVDGSRAFTAPVAGVDGTASSHLATKGQLDAMAQGVDWQDSVLSFLSTPPGSPATGARYVIGASPTGAWSGKANQIAEWSGSAWVYTVPNKGFTTQDESVGVNYNFNGTAWVTMGSTIAHNTLSGLTTGDPHTQYTLRTDGSSVANSNKWMIRNAQARAEAMGLTHTATTKLDVLGPGDLELIAGSNPALDEASALLRGRAGIKLQVNDATVPATIRTPLEIIREADGVGTADLVAVNDYMNVGGLFVNKTSLAVTSADNDGLYMGGAICGLRGDEVFVGGIGGGADYVRFTPGVAAFNGSNATAGQLRLVDGEILNAKGSTGAEVCLVSYDKTLTSAVFGSDGASARQAVTSVLAGSTSAQLVVGSTSQLEARSTHVKANTQIAAAVKTATVTTTTTTLDCSTGNVHSFSSSNASTCTVSLSNTKAGAEIELFVTNAGSGLGITLSSTWFDGKFCPGFVAATQFATNGAIRVRGRVLTDGGKCFVTDIDAP